MLLDVALLRLRACLLTVAVIITNLTLRSFGDLVWKILRAFADRRNARNKTFTK
ncbi:MAG: hypothetical protein ABSA86_05350 [Oryzomonas sp.]|jgi:hypothetical protein